MGKISRPFGQLIERLNFHIGTGEILDGFKIFDLMQERVDGKADLPSVTVFMPEATEEARGRLITNTLRLNITVSVHPDEGQEGLLSAMEKVMDAVETTHDGSGKVDQGLNGTAAGAVKMRIGDVIPLATSLSGNITVEVRTKPSEIAQRRT